MRTFKFRNGKHTSTASLTEKGYKFSIRTEEKQAGKLVVSVGSTNCASHVSLTGRQARSLYAMLKKHYEG